MAPNKPSTPPKPKPKIADPHAVKKTWTFKKYRNGLLDLKAPARYMRLAKQNSLRSPLLKLPAEIRSRIFDYATGGYDIYIKISHHGPILKLYRVSDGQDSQKYYYLRYHIATTIVPSGTGYRPAKKRDDLPNLSLSRVCRQMYTEAALLPYMLNNFKFVGHLETDIPRKFSDIYTPLDFWMEKRTPAQKNVITSVRPTESYIREWRISTQPAFLMILPRLKTLDLHACWGNLKARMTEQANKTRASKKDLAGNLKITWPDEEVPFRTHRSANVDRSMASKTVHFNKAIYFD